MSVGRPLIAIRLDPWQIKALKALAYQTGMTVSDLVRAQIDALLDEHDISPQPDTRDGQITTNDYGV